ncbi:EAL domain-containing protein [Castellaniella sp.]|uniref:bifunctional diguanylate cyclase/phosphodiesterase n=1 Tax=Castellaniella sp. TaxID=1955812 RepID=UPI00355DF539
MADQGKHPGFFRGSRYWQHLLGSVRARILLAILVATVPAMAGMGYYVVRQYHALLDGGHRQAETLIQFVAAYDKALIDDAQQLLAALSHSPVLRHRRWDECSDYLTRLVTHLPTYTNLGMVDASGQVLCSAWPDTEPMRQHLGDRAYFQAALVSSGVVTSNFVLGRLSHHPVMVLAQRIQDDAGQVTGVLFASLDLRVLQGRAVLPELMPGAYLWILDRQGHALPHRSVSVLPPERRIDPYPDGATGLERRRFQDDARRIWFELSLPAGPASDHRGLSVRYQIPLESLQAEANQALWAGFLGMGLLLMLALLAAWGLVQLAAGHSLDVLGEGVRRLAARDFSWRVADRLRGRELQLIGRQFDEMAAAVQRYESSLERSERSYRELFDNSPTPMLVRDRTSGYFLAANQQAEQMYGHGQADFPALGMEDLRLQVVEQQADAMRTFEIHKGVEGAERYVEVRRLPVTFAGRAAEVLVVQDLTEQRARQKALAWWASHDVLTGLLNRPEFIRRLDALLPQAGPVHDAPVQRPSGVLVLGNLDAFKEVNTALGHESGDRLLVQVARRLREELGPDCLLARLGGDEFVFLLQDTHRVALHRAEHLVTQMRAPFNLDNLQLRVSATFGLVMLADLSGAYSPDDLIRYADAALRRARNDSASVGVCDERDYSQMQKGLLMRGELRVALVRNQFMLHMQPKVRLRREAGGVPKVADFEVLARWQHPERGLIAPSEFIPMVEASDLVHAFTRWVVDQAVMACAAWQDRHPGVGVAVNVSVRNLLNLRFPRQVAAALRRHRLAPSLLELEVTEQVLMRDPVRAMAALHTLRNLGVRIAIDDFGTGYSSFAYLARLPVDTLKIDHSFVANLHDADTRAIVRSIIDMSHGLQLVVVAEGVESAEIQHMLADMGCDRAQGYAIARPMPMGAALEWLAAYS